MTHTHIHTRTHTHTHTPAEHGDDEGEKDDEVVLVNTEERVQEALAGIDSVADEITITSLQTDIDERECVSTFMSLGCGCSKVNGRACSTQFSTEYVTSVRESCAELSRLELDMAILGYLVGGMNTSSTVSVVSRHKPCERESTHHLSPPGEASVRENVHFPPRCWEEEDEKPH